MGLSFILFGIFLGGITPALPVDSTNYLVRNYTVQDGLPVNAVNGIVQDNDGYIFFSTLDGLVRYDGYDFKIFNSSNSPGISNNRIARIFKTTAGTLWMIGEAGSLRRYRKGYVKTYHPAGGSEEEEVLIKESSDGQLWIGSEEGLATFDDSLDQFIAHPDSLLATQILAIEPTKNGEGWAVNRHGLIRWDEGNAEIILPADQIPVNMLQVNQLRIDNSGRLWILAYGGVFCLKYKSDQVQILYSYKRHAFEGVNIVEQDNSNHIISTDKGFYTLDFTNKKLDRIPFDVHSLNHHIRNIFIKKSGEVILIGDNEVVIDGKTIFEVDNIQAGLVDREGSIWVATRREGIFQIRPTSIKNISPQQGLPIRNVYPIIQTSDSTIWAGSLEGGLFKFKDSKITRVNKIDTRFTRSLFEDTDGSIYAGLSTDQLWRFWNDQWEKINTFKRGDDLSQATIYAMHRDRTGRLIVGTRGLAKVQQGGTFSTLTDNEGRSLQKVRVIKENKDGHLYFGTNGNGLVLLPQNGAFKTIGKLDGLGSDFIRDIYLQSRDTVWIATENEGLSRIIFDDHHQINAIARVTMADGLINNSLHRIIAGPYDNLWVSSNGGIMRISRSSLNAFADGHTQNLSLIAFNERDGMRNREANGGVQSAGILSAEGKLWFPNQSGITIIDPEAAQLQSERSPPKPIIEQVILEDSTINVVDDSTIMIPRDRRNLRFKFTAPNFANPDRILYKYRLSDVNDQWQLSNRGLEANYTNLGPGTYHFKLIADRLDGTQATRSLAMTIPPFFYETGWFYGLMGILVIGLIFAGYRYRLGMLERRKAVLQKQVDRQTKELKKAAKQKSRFFTGITHELKTPLSLIMSPLDDMIEDKDAISEGKSLGYLKMMRRNGKRLRNLVDQILDVSKLNAEAIKLTLRPVDLEPFTVQIVGQFQSLLDEKSISLEIDKTSITDSIFVDEDAWERIIINLMSNAIKHSSVGSNIRVFFEENRNVVMVHLLDFGKGIAEHEQGHVFEYLYQVDADNTAGGTGIGLFLVRELVERMGGKVELQSEVGQGAEFIITLKKGYGHFHAEDTVLHEPIMLQETPAPDINDDKEEIKKTTQNQDAEHILIVEDNSDFRKYLASVLSDDYRTTVACNGREGLEKLQNAQPDLIISDVMMPEMNGLDFVKKIRSIEKFKRLPVIFLSAKDTQMDVERGLSTGADIYHTKPLKSSTLRSQVTAVLRRERVLKQHEENSKTDNGDNLKTQVRNLIYRQLGNPNLNIAMVADALYLSRSKLYREWNKVSDCSPNEFIIKVRMEEARTLLTDKAFSVQEAARAVGYDNPAYFSSSFKKTFGEPPSEA